MYHGLADLQQLLVHSAPGACDAAVAGAVLLGFILSRERAAMVVAKSQLHNGQLAPQCLFNHDYGGLDAFHVLWTSKWLPELAEVPGETL